MIDRKNGLFPEGNLSEKLPQLQLLPLYRAMFWEAMAILPQVIN